MQAVSPCQLVYGMEKTYNSFMNRASLGRELLDRAS